MTAPRVQSLTNLTRRHGVKVASAVSVEDCCLAAGEVVGHEHIMSASRMNSSTVLFLSSIEKANQLVETGIVINELFTPVLPLSMPSKKVLLSNVPPFVSEETLIRIMSRYGKLVSPIKMIPIGCKSALLKHVLSFRRFVFMILKEDEELDLSLRFKIDGCDYIFYATTEKMKCFNCGEAGHLIRACPTKTNAEGSGANNADEPAEAGPSNAAPLEVVAGKANEGDDTNRSANASANAQVTEHITVIDINTSVNANVSTSESVVETGIQESGGMGNVVQSDLLCDGIETEAEQNEFKVPAKRKNTSDMQAVKAKKADVENVYCDEDMESGSESSDSSVSMSQSDFSCRSYEVEDIKLFLKATKNKRGVRVFEYFPDIKQFVDKTKLFMSEGLFTKKEIYRLKKIVTRLTSESVLDGT